MVWFGSLSAKRTEESHRLFPGLPKRRVVGAGPGTGCVPLVTESWYLLNTSSVQATGSTGKRALFLVPPQHLLPPGSLLALWATGCKATGWVSWWCRAWAAGGPPLLPLWGKEQTHGGTCCLTLCPCCSDSAQWVEGSGLNLLETDVCKTFYREKWENLAVLLLRHLIKSAFLCLLSLDALGKNLLKPTWITSSTSPSTSGTQPFPLVSWKCVVGKSWNSSSPQSSGPW